MNERGGRLVRAAYTDETITGYQAYSPQIADAAVAAGTFVAPFSRERMTWIKPSFGWMMQRCGWARKRDRLSPARAARVGAGPTPAPAAGGRVCRAGARP